MIRQIAKETAYEVSYEVVEEHARAYKHEKASK